MAIRINRVYTRTGDRGDTGLVGGRRVGKDDPRIDCYGTVDELNATIGLARLHCQSSPQSPAGTEGQPSLAELDSILARVQNELFNLGSLLSTRAEDLRPTQPVVSQRHVEALEHEIDRYNEDLPELRSFVLPGGGSLGAYLHLCRTVCRRTERLAVALSRRETVPDVAIHYLNRLSDALFVWARFAAKATAQPEVLWQPEKT
jgi:cob(I)alamin adenosyltransferase